ncbi:MAG: hypothetical protein ABSG26_17905 [Bryobacteraceae bacterium]|jgi:hypothetical protein
MNRALLGRAKEYDLFPMLFAEKVLLAAVAPLPILLASSPMELDRQQQISAAIALLAGRYCIARGTENKAKGVHHRRF